MPSPFPFSLSLALAILALSEPQRRASPRDSQKCNAKSHRPFGNPLFVKGDPLLVKGHPSFPKGDPLSLKGSTLFGKRVGSRRGAQSTPSIAHRAERRAFSVAQSARYAHRAERRAFSIMLCYYLIIILLLLLVVALNIHTKYSIS